MLKLLVILLVALVFEAVGVVLLNRGLKEVGTVAQVSPAGIARVIRRGATNGNILLGVFFEALFFAGLLILMSKSDVSFLWPLTSLGFVLTTLAARFYLKEDVTLARWAGVCLIVIGAGIITWTEQTKHGPQTEPGPPPARPAVTPARSQGEPGPTPGPEHQPHA